MEAHFPNPEKAQHLAQIDPNLGLEPKYGVPAVVQISGLKRAQVRPQINPKTGPERAFQACLGPKFGLATLSPVKLQLGPHGPF